MLALGINKAFLAFDLRTVREISMLASLVPDEVIYNIQGNPSKSTVRTYDASLLIGDISGFTELSSRFILTGKGGPSTFSEILNLYIGSTVEEILKHGGDVLHLSADEFVAMWKVNEECSLEECVNKSLECALVIRKYYGRGETETGVDLRIKLGISCGEMHFSTTGKNGVRHHTISGKPVWEVKVAHFKCEYGDMIVSHSARTHVNLMEYLYEYLPDRMHVKILGVAPSWRHIKGILFVNPNNDREKSEEEDHIPLAYSDRVAEPEAEAILMSLSGETIVEEASLQNAFSLRPSVRYAIANGIKDNLRAFIIAPVRNGLEGEEPLDYLTEMRQLVTVFVNVMITSSDPHTCCAVMNECFQIVCDIVVKAGGCVSRASLFDKRITYLIVFGLRGSMSDIDTGITLKCSAQILTELLTVTAVMKTSIGVTTGLTYCGVVGHVLRREYTVLGIPVHKAARLMIAYPGKVSCDRETFLHSKLEACHFELQEAKEIKEFLSLGPIYEFKEHTLENVESPMRCKYPLLSRSKELHVFQTLLSTMEKRRQHGDADRKSVITSMIIQGPPRQGKSRLLNEMLHIVKDRVPILKLQMNIPESQVPFAGIRNIFLPLLGISGASQPSERQGKLILKLSQETFDQKLLCCLNSVFHVNFQMSQKFASMDSEHRNEQLKMMMRKLSRICFRQIRVIAIDDSELLDEESWTLLPTLIEQDGVLLAMTVGDRQELPETAAFVMNHRKVHRLNLDGIEKWFLSGLVCQILNVVAIPLELEEIVLARSYGNPGWIESCLTNLLQSGNIVLKTVCSSAVDNMGLVTALPDMLVRNDTETSLPFNTVTSNERAFQCKYNRYRAEQLKIATSKDFVNVCVLSSNCNLECYQEQATVDMLVMRIFNSLSPIEKEIVRCSSVIGETFHRRMLSTLMKDAPVRQVTLAIQNLFEMGYVVCASGVIPHSSNVLLRGHRRIALHREQHIVCSCNENQVDATCTDLPIYASCAHMRFRMPAFRDTVYKLLSGIQKRDMHSKAITYLESETKRCQFCKGGNFTKILGNIHSIFGARAEGMAPAIVDDKNKTVTPASVFTQTSYEQILSQKLQFSTGDPVLPLTGRLSLSSNGVLIEPHTPFVSTWNITDCRCALILTSVYIQLVDHCVGTGHQDKVLDALLDYSQLCMILYNHLQAVKLLEHAESVLTSKPRLRNEIARWKTRFLRGKIHTMMGYCRMQLGQFEEAQILMMKAMGYYGTPFPVGKSVNHHRMHVIMDKLQFRFPCNTVDDRLEVRDAHIVEDLVTCLTHMFSLFTARHQWKHAKLAAAWCLNRVLASHDDFSSLCNAFMNMLIVAQHDGNFNLEWHIERFVLKLCQNKTNVIEIHELRSIGRLYLIITECRLLRGDLEKAAILGFKALRIYNAIRDIQAKLELLPKMIDILCLRLRFSEAAMLLNDFFYTSCEDVDSTGRVHYFAKTIDFQLYTGYTTVPFKICEKFYQEEGNSLITVRDQEVKIHFNMNMWLWFLRNEDREAASIWENKANVDFDMDIAAHHNAAHASSALRLLECLLLHLVGTVDNRNVKTFTALYTQIHSLLKFMEKITKIYPILAAHYLILKAYYRLVKYNDPKATVTTLKKAKKIATKQGNLLFLHWAEHNEKVWKRTITPILVNRWKEHRVLTKVGDWHEAELGHLKMTLYSLPLPLLPFNYWDTV